MGNTTQQLTVLPYKSDNLSFIPQKSCKVKGPTKLSYDLHTQIVPSPQHTLQAYIHNNNF